MIDLTLEQLADVVGGDLVDWSTASTTVRGVSIDSRSVVDGDLFVALDGTRTDGHRFVSAALRAGAAAALIAADRVAGTGETDAAVVVDDPADALLALGAWVRDTVDPHVIAITGSNGKTTTKDLTAAATSSRRTVANEGSYNNELGVPLTCCRLVTDTEIMVNEIGMRGLGHIAALAEVVKPDVGIVTSVAPVHLELLGSIEAIAQAKSELVQALPIDGVAVLAADDHRVAAMADRTGATVVTFGTSQGADFRAVDIELDDAARPRFVLQSPQGRHDVTLPVAGMHNVGNALAAIAAAAVSGVELSAAVKGVADATVSRWRLQMDQVGGVRVLNDAYNANPASVAAALRTLAALPTPGRRWAVLGTMAEIGPTSADEHRRTGHVAADLGVDGLVTVGPQAAAIADGARAAAGSHMTIRPVDDIDDAIAVLDAEIADDDVILVKASRSAALERVVTGFARCRQVGAGREAGA